MQWDKYYFTQQNNSSPPPLQNYPGCAYVFILYLMDLMQIRNQSQLIIDKVYAERV